MVKLTKNKILKLLGFIWGNRNLKYITILLLLISGLLLFTDSRKTFFSKAAVSSEKGYFFYLPSSGNRTLSRLESIVVKNLARTNDLEFVKVKPLKTGELKSLLDYIAEEKRLDASNMMFNLISFVNDYKDGMLRSFDKDIIDLKNPKNRHQKDISFLKWLKGIDNYQTTFKNITPYDDIIKKYAKEFGIDWRLIAAQMFIESSFNPKSTSFAGAMGLMQITPIAMKEMGMQNAYNVEENIYHGIKYLKSRFEMFSNIPKHSKPQFALASYNAGIGHLRDAQRLALRNGLNPKKWDNSIDEMFLDLAYYDETHEAVWYGYCRGEETVNYVNKVMSRYNLYKNLVYSE